MRQTFNGISAGENNFLLKFEARVNIITAGDYEFDINANDEIKFFLEE